MLSLEARLGSFKNPHQTQCFSFSASNIQIRCKLSAAALETHLPACFRAPHQPYHDGHGFTFWKKPQLNVFICVSFVMVSLCGNIEVTGIVIVTHRSVHWRISQMSPDL